ncbi:LOG family protein [Paraglaciecola sp. MB-3u-78]|jgi:uncharacterized protein (TIGR00730 family)|uniref:LOG family protein n=1 Tax=Paraglaciecola sp. MB-3u-78 TaxID=2058332 RepID=UPI000C34276D|nr:LOG family protein [Paraglaciecola sp. MB-3u-78]PKG99585.1 cytochrome D ubiquinol oxidase subunit II [Paraglaciecola sp. MB-3u-78]
MPRKNFLLSIPKPPHSIKRKEALPWQKPKPISEDPAIENKLDAIMTNRSYVPAIEDIDFLKGPNARGIRLQLDYLKPQVLLNKHGIEHTIVVFGSTRIVEPQGAQDRIDSLKIQLEQKPQNKRLIKKLAVAKRIQHNSQYYLVAREFAGLVGKSGNGPNDSQLVIMTGGGPGIMEAANRGAAEAQAETVGLNITLPNEQFPNPYVTPELCFQFHYFAIRKLHFVLRARALVAFPGGYGTLDELFETLTLIQTRKITPMPVVLVGQSFWQKAVDIDFLVDEGVIDEEDRDLFWYAETAEDIWLSINKWYADKGESLQP